MTRFGLGYKRDVYDERDAPAEGLLGQPAHPGLLIPASLMPYAVGRLEQGGASSCVAHAICRAIDVALRYAARASMTGEAPAPKPSRRFIYWNARRQEAVEALAKNEPVAPMTDGGCFGRLAMRGVQKLGYCPETIFPYSDSPQAIAEMPSPQVYRASFDQSGFRYYRISAVGHARVVEVARALAQGKPVIFGLFVDKPFLKNKGAVIDSVDTTDPDGGGHMVCALEVKADEVIHDNWWGEEWGQHGLGRLTHKFFGGPVINDVYVVDAAPTFSGTAA